MTVIIPAASVPEGVAEVMIFRSNLTLTAELPKPSPLIVTVVPEIEIELIKGARTVAESSIVSEVAPLSPIVLPLPT